MRYGSLAFILWITLFVGVAVAADAPKPGTDGTVTSWDDAKKVVAVETCSKKPEGDWDYVGCMRILKDKTVAALCKRGKGSYTWKLQIGSEKSLLTQATSCK
jgi:hypothetical protein